VIATASPRTSDKPLSMDPPGTWGSGRCEEHPTAAPSSCHRASVVRKQNDPTWVCYVCNCPVDPADPPLAIVRPRGLRAAWAVLWGRYAVAFWTNGTTWSFVYGVDVLGAEHVD
jgi:hypothetical protein